MLPVIALVGRPNVGKSTLFNYLTRSRDAIVADYPGLTRDRQFGFGKRGSRPYLVVDTGGLTGDPEMMDELIAGQVERALAEADAVVFMTDGRTGINATDEQIVRRLRNLSKPLYLAVNKTEGLNANLAVADFHTIGIQPVAISAQRGDGVVELVDDILALLPDSDDVDIETLGSGTRVAICGRPNVGKSTLVNRILGEERVVASNIPGTTRDSVFIPFERSGRDYTLIDTAGMRRRAKIDEEIEKFSIAKTLKAVDTAQVAVFLLDASEDVTEQDARLIGLVLERGRAMVLAINKWDGLPPEQRERVKDHLDLKLPFLNFARRHFISAKHGTGVGDLFKSIDEAQRAGAVDLSTPKLTRLLEGAVEAHPPPSSRGRAIKLRYAHQGGMNPPVIVIHGNQTDRLPSGYRRYLINYYREALQLFGTPIRIELKTGDNPYAGRRNKLTPRQEYKRKRLIRHIKKSGR